MAYLYLTGKLYHQKALEGLTRPLSELGHVIMHDSQTLIQISLLNQIQRFFMIQFLYQI